MINLIIRANINVERLYFCHKTEKVIVNEEQITWVLFFWGEGGGKEAFFQGSIFRIKNSKFALSKDASYNNDLNRLLSDELPNESYNKGEIF